MKAIVLNAFGGADQFSLKDMPTPALKDGEVRIRVKCASFNPVDYKIRMGEYGGSTPLILGSDCSGVIDEVGSGVKEFVKGDEVIALCFGQCSNGSYAEMLSLPASFVAKKPKNVSFEEAAAFPLVALTAYRAMVASYALKKEGSIFIAGAAGGVGSIAVQLARHFHKGPIFSVAGSEESISCLTQTLKLDRKNIVNYKGLSIDALKEKLIALNGGELFSATFDFVGGDMKRLCVELAHHSGDFATIVPEPKSFEIPVFTRGISPFVAKNLSLHLIFVGSEAFSGGPKSWKIYQQHLIEIVKLIESKALSAPMIKVVGNLSVETVKEAHRLLEEGKVKGKLVMKVS